MCGFILALTKKAITSEELNKANIFIRNRGPSHTSHLSLRAGSGKFISLSHSLLDISGSMVTQPYQDNKFKNQYLLFNGEIYNYQEFGDFKSDTESIIAAHDEQKENFGKSIVGEYAIVLMDLKRSIIEIMTDPFMTKPLFWGRSDDPSEIGLASYPSALTSLGFKKIQSATANTRYQVDFSNGNLKISEEFPVYKFNTKQYKSNFNDWEEAFIESIRKRATHGAHQPMLSLSSGYDSGAISLAMRLLNIKHHVFTVDSGENSSIIEQRLAFCSNVVQSYVKLPAISKTSSRKIAAEIAQNVDPTRPDLQSITSRDYSLNQDAGAQGCFLIAREASSKHIKVNLSGAGADEIFSDYGHAGIKFINHSEFGGLFPDNIDNFFPWKKFYGDTQSHYLFKEEIIFGHFGIESRYPMLDREVVQEFLSLEHHLKNNCYKAPLDYFMNKYNYPFEKNIKRGFSVRNEPHFRKVKNYIKKLFDK